MLGRNEEYDYNNREHQTLLSQMQSIGRASLPNDQRSENSIIRAQQSKISLNVCHGFSSLNFHHRISSPNAHPDSGHGECYKLTGLFVP